jgi:hypothetical protein
MKLKRIKHEKVEEYVDEDSGVEIVIAEPPVFKRAVKVFDIKGPSMRPVFAYGGRIWNPFKGGIDDAIIAHEKVHFKQMGYDSEIWWENYFIDPAFRLEMEIPAYRAQFLATKKMVKDREWLNQERHRMASDLSGPLYGNAMTYAAAFRAVGL